MYINTDEESLRARKGCIRSTTSFNQVEFLQIVTSESLLCVLPNAVREVYAGASKGNTNHGNKIGDVILPAIDTLWALPCKQKHDLFGSYQKAVGGKTEGEEVGRGIKRKTGATVEPVFWHSRPAKLFQELVGSYKLTKGIIDFGMGDGVLATYCALNRIPYFGFALTETHLKLVKEKIIAGILDAMATEGGKEYNPHFASMLKGTISTAPEQGNKRPRKTAHAKPEPAEGKSADDLLKGFKDKIDALRKNEQPAKEDDQDDEEQADSDE